MIILKKSSFNCVISIWKTKNSLNIYFVATASNARSVAVPKAKNFLCPKAGKIPMNALPVQGRWMNVI